MLDVTMYLTTAVTVWQHGLFLMVHSRTDRHPGGEKDETGRGSESGDVLSSWVPIGGAVPAIAHDTGNVVSCCWVRARYLAGFFFFAGTYSMNHP